MDTVLANSRKDIRRGSYDIVVVGSWYGGAITAARLANAAISPKLSVGSITIFWALNRRSFQQLSPATHEEKPCPLILT